LFSGDQTFIRLSSNETFQLILLSSFLTFLFTHSGCSEQEKLLIVVIIFLNLADTRVEMTGLAVPGLYQD